MIGVRVARRCPGRRVSSGRRSMGHLVVVLLGRSSTLRRCRVLVSRDGSSRLRSVACLLVVVRVTVLVVASVPYGMADSVSRQW